MYQIVMLDIVEFLEQTKLDSILLTSDTQEERYVELICLLFNEYVATNGHKYVGVDFDIPEFAKRPEFSVNIAFIKNARTKEILDNEYMRNLFKIMLSSFRKHRKNATDILTNTIIGTINDIVDNLESKVRDTSTSNNALDFETFMKSKKFQNEASMFEQEIFEGIIVNYKEYGNKKVNFVSGRYQPFTNGHIKVFEELYRKNKLPLVVGIVRGTKPNPEKNPISEDVQLRMFAALQKQYKFLESAIILGSAGIDKIFNGLRPAYEPVLWGTGTDRVKSYEYQVKVYKDDLNPLPEFKIEETKRTDKDISATKVREALAIEDKETFNKLTPKSIHKFFDELKDIITINKVVVEQVINELDCHEPSLTDEEMYSFFNEDLESFDPIWVTMNESIIATPTPRELSDILLTTRTFSDTVLQKIGVLLGIEQGADEELMTFLTNIQIPEKRAQEIVNTMLSFPNSSFLTKYIQNRTLDMSKMLDKKINLIELAGSVGLNKKMVQWLIEYRWPASPVIGPAEIALAILINGGKRPRGGQAGDLIVNDIPIEVKGTGGRLRGQHGYGNGRSFKVVVVDALQSLSTQYTEGSVTVPSDIGGKDDLFYNFTRGNWGVEKIGMELISKSKGKVTSKDIANVLALGLKALYLELDLKYTEKWLNKYINKDGSFNQTGMMDELFIVSFEYYASVEDFEYVMITDSRGNIVTIKNSDFRKNVGKTIKYGVPNFGERAGQQGMAFAISLK
jgi:hypothetical protein